MQEDTNQRRNLPPYFILAFTVSPRSVNEVPCLCQDHTEAFCYFIFTDCSRNFSYKNTIIKGLYDLMS